MKTKVNSSEDHPKLLRLFSFSFFYVKSQEFNPPENWRGLDLQRERERERERWNDDRAIVRSCVSIRRIAIARRKKVSYAVRYLSGERGNFAEVARSRGKCPGNGLGI